MKNKCVACRFGHKCGRVQIKGMDGKIETGRGCNLFAGTFTAVAVGITTP